MRVTGGAGTEASDEKARILIVDDDPIGRETLEALLLKENYELAFAENGPKALSLASEFTPDAILLDVMMPGMDGFEVCRRLRDDQMLSTVTIIMITALDDRGSRLQGIEAGADDFITKPYDRTELRARLRTIANLNRYRRLLEERTKFEIVVENAEVGYLLVKGTGVITFANPKACRYFAGSEDREDLRALSFPDLAAGTYRTEPQTVWDRWAAGSFGPVSVPCYLIRPECDRAPAFWLEVTVIPVSSDENLVNLRDITARISARREIWTFHSQINHKLRTPLASLTGFLRLMEDEPAMDERTRMSYLASALGSACRLESEIEDILEYLDVTKRTVGGECRVDEIASIARKVCTALELSFDVEIRGEISTPAEPVVAASAHVIELILTELCENAKKFHPQNTPQITIDIGRVASGVRIRVRDNGITLSPPQLERMWHLYYQAERFTTGQVAGMGLGLSVVASLVWSVGGICRSYNREDMPGVVIEIIIPAVERI